MPTLTLSLLGPFEVFLDQQPVSHFRTKSVQALLAYLVVEARNPQSREFLGELLWPGMPPASSRKNLRQSLYELRQLIPEVSSIDGDATEPLLLADREKIQINPQGQIEADIDSFTSYLESDSLESLGDGVALYRGEFLEGFFLPENNEFESWLAGQREYYRRKILDSLDLLAQASLKDGHYQLAEAHARQQIQIDDLRESAVQHLMTALALQGQRAGALSQYEKYSNRLTQELNVVPGPELAELNRTIREGRLSEQSIVTFSKSSLSDQQVDLPGHRLFDVKPGASKKSIPQNLPVPSTPFIGRRDELERLKKMLQEDATPRLITLLGPGGSGKTRLAIQVALDLYETEAEQYRDGIWFISLAKLTEPKDIVSELATVLRFSFPGRDISARQQILDYLCQKQMLLVLDNYEHLLVSGAVPLAADIVSAAANVKVIVTSRTRINVQGEHLLPIAGLSIADEKRPGQVTGKQLSDAVQLFWHSARRIQPEFEVTDDNQEAVGRICNLVEGIPLAIELAASWVELLSPGEIAREIEKNLDFLETDWRDIPERQRSLKAVFDGSWKTLPSGEREAIKRLTVFQGSFSHEAALATAGASLKTLLNLSNRSWLIRDGTGRYHIHSLLWRYAGDKFEEGSEDWRETREAHTAYYTSLLPKLSDEMRGPGQQSAFEIAAVEFENIRTTWYRLLEEERFSEMVEYLLPGIFLFCTFHSLGEDLLTLVRDAQQPLIGRESVASDSRPLAVLMTAETAFLPGRSVMQLMVVQFMSWVFEKERLISLWQALHEVTANEANPLWLIISATLYGWQVDRKLAIDRLRELVNAFHDYQDRWFLAYAMQNLARLLTQTGAISSKDRREELPSDIETKILHEYAMWIESRQLLTKAEAIFTDIGDQLEKANTLRLSGLLQILIDLEGAEKDLLSAMQIMQNQGDPASAANVLWNLAEVSIMQGDAIQGFSYYDEMIDIYERLGNRQLIGTALSMKSINLLRFGDIEDARAARIQSLKLYREVNDDQMSAWALWELGEIERVAKEYDAASVHFEEAWAIFQRLDETLGHTFYFRGLGDIYFAEGNPIKSLDCFNRSLEIAQSRHDWSVVYALGGRGRALLALEQYQDAGAEFWKGLKLAYEINHIDLTMGVLAGVCKLLQLTGREAQAVELGTFVYHHHMSWVEVKNQVLDTIKLASMNLSDEESKIAQDRGKNASREAVVAQYLAELSTDSNQVQRLAGTS